MNRLSHRIVASRSLLIAPALLAASLAHARTYDVTTTVDLPDDGAGVVACHTTAGGCSLRAAIMKSNQSGEANIINVPAGTYMLTIPPGGSDDETVGDLNITASVTIIGKGMGRTIIDGNTIDRVVDISSGQFVSFTGVTIRNGSRRGGGGGIRNAGLLTLDHCAIEDNFVSTDGTNGDGGGIYTSGSLDVFDSVIRSNEAQGAGSGGGISAAGSVNIRRSTIADNRAGDGGGIHVAPSSAFVYLSNSTVSGNAAANNGGGINSVGAGSNIVALYSSSVIGNDASHDDDQFGQGGGICAIRTDSSRFLVTNTLIGNNTINQRNAFNDCAGTIEAYGFNLFSLAVIPNCIIGGNGSDAWGGIFLPSIGPLQDNGGPTPTHALLENSEAINATTSQGCVDENGNPLDTDQRGAPRISGFRCDVGAFEYGSVVDLIFKDGYD